MRKNCAGPDRHRVKGKKHELSFNSGGEKGVREHWGKTERVSTFGIEKRGAIGTQSHKKGRREGYGEKKKSAVGYAEKKELTGGFGGLC